MKFYRLFSPVLLGSTLLFSGCASEEEEVKPDPYEGRHSDFYPRKDFHIGREFNKVAANRLGYEGIQRSIKEIHNHMPEIKVLENGKKIEVRFPRHPHLPKHYWAWIEIVDQNGTEVYEEIDEPGEDIKDFKIVMTPKKTLKKRIRVRAFCYVHGEFQEYFDLPESSEKTIID